MKSCIFFVLLASSICQAQITESRWEQVGAVDFTAIARQSSSRIVAATAHGYLYYSDDNGNAWARKELDDTLQLADIDFLDSLHGVIIDDDRILFLTTDGGSTWNRRELAAHVFLSRVSYASIDTLFLCTNLGKIFRSIDGGATWNEQITSITKELHDIRFVNSRRGYAVGSLGVFLSTSDAGEHWESRDIGGGDSIDLYCMDILNQTYAIGGLIRCFTSTDGGVTWNTHLLPDSAKAQIFVIKLTSDSSFFAFGPSGQVYTSSHLDSIAVSLINVHQFGIMRDGIFNTSQGAIVAGNAGTIIQSSNIKEWKPVNQCPIHLGILQSAGVNNNSIHAVQSGGPFFAYSNDGGIFWNGRYNARASAGNSGLHFFNSDTGIVFQETGFWMKTTDNGDSWQDLEFWGVVMRAYTPPSFYKNLGYIGGHNNTSLLAQKLVIFKSVDNGFTWKDILVPLDSSTPFLGMGKAWGWSFISIAAPDSLYGFASVGVTDTIFNPPPGKPRIGNKHSQLYRTSDAGVSWNIMPSAPTLPMTFSVFFINRDTGFLACDSGTLYRTGNGGLTWERRQLTLTPPERPLVKIRFMDNKIGFLGTGAKEQFSTTDGGSTWVPEDIHVPSEFGAPHFWQFVFPDSNTVLALDYGLGFYRKQFNREVNSVVEDNKSNMQYLYVSLHPNPSAESFLCKLDGLYSAPLYTLRAGLFDQLGRKVIELTDDARANSNGVTSEFSVNTRLLPAGVYMLNYSIGGASYSRQVVHMK